MKLAIVGSRDFADVDKFKEMMEFATSLWGNPEVVISGGARGADTLGEQWAKSLNIPTIIYNPDWSTYGKRAGILRNIDIINNSTHVIAFPSKRGKGTQHSIKLAEKQGKPLIIHWID